MGKVKKAVLFLLLKTAVIISAVFIILNWVIAVRICRSNDMYPNVRDGDLVIIQRTKDVSFDDVILYEADGKEYYGRIVAVAGEEVRIENDSGLWVEDSLVYNELPYLTRTDNPDGYYITVPKGQFFVLGDLRDRASDSRSFGCVSPEQVIGKELFLMRWRGF